MTKEEKNLLLQDLCPRLPYGVKATTTSNLWNDTYIVSGYADDRIYLDCPVYDEGDNEWLVEFVKPYLRPMSSMTEEEWKEFDWFVKQESDEILRFRNTLKFYNIHHIDYIGLIPMGLALEAPEGMYND